jgi:hypothetical protein
MRDRAATHTKRSQLGQDTEIIWAMEARQKQWSYRKAEIIQESRDHTGKQRSYRKAETINIIFAENNIYYYNAPTNSPRLTGFLTALE